MRGKTVLIVDDEKRMADSLADLLNGCGYRAATAYGGHEALERLAHASFQVVVTDLRMRDVDGLDVIRHIHERHPRTLVIVITGHATTESAIEAVHYQVFDYLRKPFEFDLFRMAIEKAFQKIETDQLREDVAAMITHDIKIPLTSIIGFASMIYDKDAGVFHPRAESFVQTIQANGQKILDLIENYLTTCKIESGTLRLTPVPVDLRQMIQDVMATESIEAERHGQRIEAEFAPGLPAVIELDEVLTYRALGNLLQNAIKYGTPERPILLRARRLAAADSPLGQMETLCLEVLNHGENLAPEQFAGVFDRYHRAQAHRTIEGSGIGLYVVHSVARAHGGQVRAEFLGEDMISFAMYLPLVVRAEHEP